MLAIASPRIGRAVRTDEQLVNALRALALGHGEVIAHAQRAWASITFAGTRHKLTLAFDGEDAVVGGEQLVEQLPEAELKVRRHLVADAAIASAEHQAWPPRLVLDVEILLLEEEPQSVRPLAKGVPA